MALRGYPKLLTGAIDVFDAGLFRPDRTVISGGFSGGGFENFVKILQIVESNLFCYFIYPKICSFQQRYGAFYPRFSNQGGKILARLLFE